jgi:hypothetical protein
LFLLLESLRVESSFLNFSLAACFCQFFLVFSALGVLEQLKLGLKDLDSLAVNSLFFLGLRIFSEFSTQILIVQLDFVVRVPDVIALNHRDVGIEAERFHAVSNSERVKNRNLLSAL